MAKEKETKKVAEKTAEVTVNEDNVMDQVRNGNLMKQSNVEEALKMIEKEKDEKQQREARNMIMNSQYTNLRELIELRARRREARISKESLEKSKAALDEVLAGKKTPTEYRADKQKFIEEKKKAMRESDETLSKEIRELRSSYAGQFQWDWDY